jgi:hypothetical protein
MIKRGLLTTVIIFISFSFSKAQSSGGNTSSKVKTSTANVIPAQSLSFTAIPVTDFVKINWTTINEVNNSFFTVERSADCENFEAIKRVNGVVKNSATFNYEVLDYAPLKGISYYRLRLTDFEGKQTYSEAANILFPSPGNMVLTRNATSGNFILDFKTSKETEDNYTIEILNPLGQSVFKETLTAFTGRYNREIDLMSIGKSAYMLSITTSTEKIIKRIVAY